MSSLAKVRCIAITVSISDDDPDDHRQLAADVVDITAHNPGSSSRLRFPRLLATTAATATTAAARTTREKETFLSLSERARVQSKPGPISLTCDPFFLLPRRSNLTNESRSIAFRSRVSFDGSLERARLVIDRARESARPPPTPADEPSWNHFNNVLLYFPYPSPSRTSLR